MNVMGIIFTNDADMGELTDKRTMASLPFGGRYRQVDFALSNLSYAGVRHVGIISRFNYQSLMNHIGDGEEWGLELEEGGLEFLTPYAQSVTHTYRGKLESLANAMDFLEFGADDELVVMTDSAILSNIDLTAVLNAHVASGKDVTVVTKAGICNGSKIIDLAVKVDEKGEFAVSLVVGMKYASCVICPYVSGSQSGITHTAMVFGTPVIATKVGAFEEFIEQGKNGMLVDYGDTRALAECISYYENDHNVNIFVPEKLKWRNIVREAIDFFEQFSKTNRPHAL